MPREIEIRVSKKKNGESIADSARPQKFEIALDFIGVDLVAEETASSDREKQSLTSYKVIPNMLNSTVSIEYSYNPGASDSTKSGSEV